LKKIKIFLGAYINSTNAQNLNCLALAKHLNKEKFDVYTLELYSGNLENNTIDGVKVFRCFYPHKISMYIGYLWGIWKSDVVYLPKGELDDWNKFWLKLFQKKSFSTIEGILDEAALKNAISHYGSSEMAVAHYRNFDKLYSITDFMRNYNLKHHAIDSESKILYLGTDIQTFLNESKNSTMLQQVIIIGNDLIRKGVYDYLELAATFSNITFHVVGTGNGKIDINNEMEKKGLKNIVYHGGLTHFELVNLLKKIDLHIFPSRSEGFPKVTLETAAAGVPSLVYSDYGAREWITDHKDGFVVDTIDEMKMTIEELIDNRQLLQYSSKNAIEMAKRFDWKVLVKEWENEITALVKGK